MPSRRRLQLTPLGKACALGTVLVAMAAANTNANLLYVVLGMLGSALVLSVLQSRAAVLGVELELRLPRRAMVDAPFSALAVVRRPGRFEGSSPLGIRLPDGLGGRTLQLLHTGHETQELVFEARAPARGRLEVTKVDLESSAPFGMVIARRRIAVDAGILVVPRIHPVSAADAVELQDAEGLPIASSGDGSSLRELRAYIAGEDSKRIHWKASARTPWPLVKVLHADATSRQRVVFEPARLRHLEHESFEREVSRAASQAAHHLNAGQSVDLVVDGRCLRGLLGRAGLERALELLALVEPVGGPGQGVPS